MEHQLQNSKKGNRPQGGQGFVDRLRLVNALIALVLVMFFFAHAVLGTIEANSGWRGTLSWLAWVGVAAAALHGVISCVTTYVMFTDTHRPPSVNKKRHQILKLASGLTLVVVFAAHATFAGVDLEAISSACALVTVLLSAALAWHIYVGGKSLTRDLSLPKGFRVPFRIAVIVLAAVVAAAMTLAWLGV